MVFYLKAKVYVLQYNSKYILEFWPISILHVFGLWPSPIPPANVLKKYSEGQLSYCS